MKIGLFGGAFNPPHVEHQKVIDVAKSTLNLDEVIVFPSYYPPHKRTSDSTPFGLRVKMCQIAFENEQISTIEQQDDYINYAVENVKKFKEIYPHDTLYYIIGGDSMADLFTWYKPEELLKMVQLVVYPRDGRWQDMTIAIKKAEEIGAKITLLDIVSSNISSAEIRYLASMGVSIDGLVVSDVANIISVEQPYTVPEIQLLKSMLTDRVYNHSVRTAVWALKLNRKLALPTSDVFKASFLHDIAKEDTSTIGVPNDAINSPVAHQFRGAKILEDLGYASSVVDAVRYHTTGCENMTTLQKLVFVADMTEEGRKFDGVDELRQALLLDFEDGFRKCIARTYEFLLKKGSEIYYLTKDAYLYYNNK